MEKRRYRKRANTRRPLRFRRRKRKLRFERRRPGYEKRNIRSILSWTVQIVIVCLIAFVLVWFWGQRVSNIGNSMKPALENGDVVLVNRVIYNASRPRRNDVIVFKPNGNENSNYYIKRIIGLPGETVQIIDGYVYINGEVLEESPNVTEIEDPGIASEPIQLAGDEYFVLGDNRSASEDSRMADIGNVKRSEIYGKAWIVVSPFSDFGLIKRE